MRIRSLKPEYWAHGMHEGLDLGVSILGAALQNWADDEGRFVASAKAIERQVLTCFEIDVEAGLRALEGLEFVILYEVVVGGKKTRLGQIVTFTRHQAISHPTPSRLPAPPGYRFVADAAGEEEDDRNGRRKKRSGKWERIQGCGNTPGTLPESSRKVPLASVAMSGESGGNTPGTLHREGMEGEDRNEGKGVSEGAGARTHTEPVSDFRDGAGRLVDRDAGVVIPTLGEVEAVCEQERIPVGFGRHFWETWTADHCWVKNGRLRTWRHHLRTWWGQDAARWEAGTHSANFKNSAGGEPPKGGTTYERPAWARIKELEEAISTHVANANSVFIKAGGEPVTDAERAELRGMRAELGRLKNGDGGSNKS